MNQAKHNLFMPLAKASWPHQQNKPCLEVPQGVAAAHPEARGREAGLWKTEHKLPGKGWATGGT